MSFLNENLLVESNVSLVIFDPRLRGVEAEGEDLDELGAEVGALTQNAFHDLLVSAQAFDAGQTHVTKLYVILRIFARHIMRMDAD